MAQIEMCSSTSTIFAFILCRFVHAFVCWYFVKTVLKRFRVLLTLVLLAKCITQGDGGESGLLCSLTITGAGESGLLDEDSISPDYASVSVCVDG